MHRGRGRAGDSRAPDDVRGGGPSRARFARSSGGHVKDPLAIGLGALACGTGLGGGTIVTALVIVRTLERHVSASQYHGNRDDPVLAGTLAGLALRPHFGRRRSRW